MKAKQGKGKATQSKEERERAFENALSQKIDATEPLPRLDHDHGKREGRSAVGRSSGIIFSVNELPFSERLANQEPRSGLVFDPPGGC